MDALKLIKQTFKPLKVGWFEGWLDQFKRTLYSTYENITKQMHL